MTINPDDYELNVIQENEQGPPGPRGIAANTVISGDGPPTANIGVIGDWYVNRETYYFYGPKDVYGWPTGYSLIGPQGFTGQVGPSGNTIFHGVGTPDNLVGVKDDWYIQAETDVWRLYGPKAADDYWDLNDYVSLIGPSGGRTIMYGTGAPSQGLGIDGDFYLQVETDVFMIYGPKATTWPAGVSLFGPQGEQGIQGPQGDPGSNAWGDITGKPNLVERDVTSTISVGYTITSDNLGTLSNFTANPALCSLQYGENAGAFQITAPAADGTMRLMVTNVTGAGTITFSGFTVASGNTGDLLTTTVGHKFWIDICRINAVSSYLIKALQ